MADENSNGVTTENPKRITRRRKPWVYLSDHAELQEKYRLLKMIAVSGWTMFTMTAFILYRVLAVG